MHEKIELSNGIRLISTPMASSQTITVLVLFGVGSKYEKKEQMGISHFLEHMFFKGTKKRPNTLAISKALDKVGGEYNAFTTKEYTGYYAKVAPEYLDNALDWVSDILLNSKFDKQEIEREKGVVKEEINMYLDLPPRYIHFLWDELLYGDQPAGWNVLGTREKVEAISQEKLFDYFRKNYRAQNAVIILSGQLPEKEKLQDKVRKYFGQMVQGRGSNKLPVKEEQSGPGCAISYKETDQTHLCLGVRAYDIFHVDRYVAGLLTAILGGMMSSRLFISVREKKGLAYYVNAACENMTDSGFLMAQAGVANDKAAQAIKAILAEFKKVGDKPIGAAEIKKAKDFLKGSMKLHLETSDEMGLWLGAQEILKNEVLTPEEVFAKIKAVSAGDLQRVARDIFRPQNLNLALIGPFKEKEKFEKLLKL